MLVWHADTDESHILQSAESAAQFLEVPVESVLQTIASGDVLRGWFVDWNAHSPSTAQ